MPTHTWSRRNTGRSLGLRAGPRGCNHTGRNPAVLHHPNPPARPKTAACCPQEAAGDTARLGKVRERSASHPTAHIWDMEPTREAHGGDPPAAEHPKKLQHPTGGGGTAAPATAVPGPAPSEPRYFGSAPGWKATAKKKKNKRNPPGRSLPASPALKISSWSK